MRLLILGGTGTTGKALVRHLRSDGSSAELTVISRTAEELPGVTRVLTGHYSDLVPSAKFRPELARFDAVVHLGDGLSILQGRPYSADTALADRLIAASAGVAHAVRDAQVPLFVYVSSIKALCDEADDRQLIEASEPRPTTAYGRSKLQLEQAVSAILEGSATRQVILRNPVMYGEGKSGSLHRLLELADTPLPLPLAGLTNRRSILAVRNFASALAAVIEAGPNSGRGVFHVHDGPALSTTQIVETLRTVLCRPTRLFPLGVAAAHAVQKMPLLAPLARRLYGSLELSDAHFRRSFAWVPVVDTKSALAEMVEQQSR